MWEAFKNGIFYLIQAFYNVAGDWGMAILIVTVIFRAIITPLVYSQTKSSEKMREIQPAIMQIKERFPDDLSRQGQETQKLYASAKYNPLAGCVPMLIQMPIFIALFQVLTEMGAYVGDSSYSFYNIIGDLTLTPSNTFEMGFEQFLPYLVLLAIFVLCTFIPTLLQTNGQSPSQIKQTRLMVAVMSIMMIFVGWNSPAGVLLFWGASSILAIVQMQLSKSIYRKKSAEQEAPQYVPQKEIVVERRQQKKRKNKKR